MELFKLISLTTFPALPCQKKKLAFLYLGYSAKPIIFPSSFIILIESLNIFGNLSMFCSHLLMMRSLIQGFCNSWDVNLACAVCFPLGSSDWSIILMHSLEFFLHVSIVYEHQVPSVLPILNKILSSPRNILFTHNSQNEPISAYIDKNSRYTS